MKSKAIRSSLEGLLIVLVVAGCSDAATGDPDDTGDTGDTNGSQDSAVEVVPGYRLVLETALPDAAPIDADGRLPRSVELVDVTSTTISSMRLAPPEGIAEEAVWATTASSSSSGRWALVHYQGVEPGVVTTQLYELSHLRPDDTAGETIVATLDPTARAEFSADESVLLLRTGQDGLVLVDLDDPERSASPALDLGGARIRRVLPRSGTSELVLVTDDQLWWHPGLPTDADPVLLHDGLGPKPDYGDLLHVELLTSDLLAFRTDGTVVLAELGEGELIEPRPIESPLGDDRSLPCDDARIIGPDDQRALVCTDVTHDTWFDPFWVPLDGREPWAFHEIGPLSRNPMAIEASANGRYLVYQAYHTSLSDREHDGLYVADTMTRSQPIRIDVENQLGSFWSCAGEVFFDSENRLSRIVGIDTATPFLEATEVAFTGPFRAQMCYENGRWGQVGEEDRRWVLFADDPEHMWGFTIAPPGGLRVGGWNEERGDLIMAELDDCLFGGCNGRVVAHALHEGGTSELWSGYYHSMVVRPILALTGDAN
jgi:hypothetical protein